MIELVVTSALDGYEIGQVITDKATVEKVLAEYPHSVVKRAAQEQAPAPAKSK